MTDSRASGHKRSTPFVQPVCTVGQVYPELLRGLCSLLDLVLKGKADSHCWYGTFYRWFQEDIALWESEKTTTHHLQAFGGMGSFNDLVPTVGLHGGKNSFARFHRVYQLLKELSYESAVLLYEARRRYPDQPDRDVLLDYRGVPVTICTCSEGHRWMKEDLANSYYTSSADYIAKMNAGFELVAKRGGESMMNWLFWNKLPYRRAPVLNAMHAAVADLNLDPKPDNCKACRQKKQLDSEILYMIGYPMAVSSEFYRVELAPNTIL